MQEGLDTGQGRVNYIVNNLEIELKTAITLDDEGNINFQLPKVENVIPLENLSKMNLSVTTAPNPAVPPVDTREIPGVIGLPREQAVELLKHGGFKIGVVTEKLSNTPAGTVIAQEPERYMRSAVGIAVPGFFEGAQNITYPIYLAYQKKMQSNPWRQIVCLVVKLVRRLMPPPQERSSDRVYNQRPSWLSTRLWIWYWQDWKWSKCQVWLANRCQRPNGCCPRKNWRLAE